jgi:DNA polymerase III delta subunit
MKYYDLFDIESFEALPKNVFLLTGDDEVIKSVFSRRLETLAKKDDRELLTTKSLDHLANVLTEGSIFGSRFIQIDYEGKWGKSSDLERALSSISQSEDFVVVRSAEPPSQPYLALFEEVECKKPKAKKSKEKWISFLASLYSVNFYEDALKKFAERAEDSALAESAIMTLGLAFPPNHHVTQSDVDKVLKEPTAKKDITRALLKKNLIKLAREMRDPDSPVYALTILHSTLFNIYCWLEMTQGGMEEEEVGDALKISPHFRKDWKLLKRHYSSKAVREVLEVTAECYEDEITGIQWSEKLQYALKKLD